MNGCAALMWIVVNIRAKALELPNSNVKTPNVCPDRDRHIDRRTDRDSKQTVICCLPRVILVFYLPREIVCLLLQELNLEISLGTINP